MNKELKEALNIAEKVKDHGWLGRTKMGQWMKVAIQLLALHERTRPRVVADGELPEADGWYLAKNKHKKWVVEYVNHRGGWRIRADDHDITHWWLLPKVGDE